MAKEFPGSIQIGVVVGGDKDDPAPDMSGNFKVWSPTEHNPNNFPADSLPFVTVLEPPTKSSQSTFGGVPDPSSMVATLKTQGQFPIVLGRFRDFVNPTQSADGNDPLMVKGIAAYNLNRGLGMATAKGQKIVEKMEGGVKVRRRSQMNDYKASDLTGLPNSGAFFHLSGYRWPALKEIETAVTAFEEVITPDMLSGLGGAVSSLAGMLRGLSDSHHQQIANTMPPSVYSAFVGMIDHMPEMEGSSDFSSDFRVDPNTYANNAVALLSQATTIYDVQQIFSTLETDETLRGTENIASLDVVTSGPFGNTTVTIHANGTSSKSQSADVTSAIQKFLGFLQSAQAASVNKGQNMFGPSAQTINTMAGRIPPDIQNLVKTTLENINSNQDHHKMTQIFQTGGGKALTDTILSGLG